MLLLNGVETRLNQLLQLHKQLARQLRRCENRVTTAPAQEDNVRGFAMRLRPLREGAHEIRFITGQESYVSRQVTNANALLFDFTQTGNPIDLRQNFQRVANERLQARIADYLAVNPEAETPNFGFRCCRSRWVENDTFTLQEVAEIVIELLNETNSGLHLARLYTELHSQVQRFVRAQRFPCKTRDR
ncbi:hypothetical protein PHYSODRAFT_295728 [Phytophthora sojae]|uniref:Uncharacterized protein n=1 Tax=Phytophthora sojae (strain P6497) TaxID=1094619 RepID=G4YY91_PHYSP|nr:hypothetical protein PHYSODRAFT_295728 [Phytophthora sojae]EGZ23242.1 hypothetical protein PHYSODRAFT_295728 [Phytophthora sojae]|eukprot:XP_009518530.1 hypothetical protein PHYSODRAFT_295728 [Phytophthora sojae]